MKQPSAPADFNDLTPDVVINLVEETLHTRCSNICRPLNSYINRVYDVHLEDGGGVICKFYRPGRWSRDALQDEQDFLFELAEAEIPVIAPLRDATGASLFIHEHLTFALFPKKGGRIGTEPTADQWKELGRLLARVHVVGAARTPRDRIRMGPEHAAEQLDYILKSGLITSESHDRYAEVAANTMDLIPHHFDAAEMIRIHGDCHHQNIIHRPGESFFIIDFDDMSIGPPVQDVWMLLPGRVKDCLREVDFLIEGYETFRPFNRTGLALVEPLRAMRYIHFTAWCIRQAADGGFKRLSPDWGSASWWKQEIHELEKQQTEIRDALEAGNLFE
ncbi:MAG: serine/threonine protein kinase [bacterium]